MLHFMVALFKSFSLAGLTNGRTPQAFGDSKSVTCYLYVQELC